MGTFRVVSGTRDGNQNATGAVIAAITDRVLSIKDVTISNRAAAAMNVTLERADGTDLIGPIAMEVNANFVLQNLPPGAFQSSSGAALNAVSTTTGNVHVAMTAWVH